MGGRRGAGVAVQRGRPAAAGRLPGVGRQHFQHRIPAAAATALGHSGPRGAGQRGLHLNVRSLLVGLEQPGLRRRPKP